MKQPKNCSATADAISLRDEIVWSMMRAECRRFVLHEREINAGNLCYQSQESCLNMTWNGTSICKPVTIHLTE